MSYWQLLDLRYLDRPTDWSKLFGRVAPLIVEIGFGRGDHLVHLAQKYPECNLIGIEISSPSLDKASRKARNHQLTHLRVLKGSGVALLWEYCSPQSIAQLHINFPDPWYKEGHHHRRLITDEFLHLAATRLIPHGELYIATDHADYQPVVTDCLERTPYFQSRLATTYALEDAERFRTKYELKAIAEGRIPFYYKWERNDFPAPDIFEPVAELAMPHVILSLPLTLSEIENRFEEFAVSAESDLSVRYLSTFRSHAHQAVLFETYIAQQPQHQHVAFIVRERAPFEYIIQLYAIGFPRATDGVHQAAYHLARWLVALHPEGRLIHHNLRLPELPVPEEVAIDEKSTDFGNSC